MRPEPATSCTSSTACARMPCSRAAFTSACAYGCLLAPAIDPARAIAGEGATSGDVEAIRKSYGFDRPLLLQYFVFLGQVLQGNLGESITTRTPGRVTLDSATLVASTMRRPLCGLKMRDCSSADRRARASGADPWQTISIRAICRTGSISGRW